MSFTHTSPAVCNTYIQPAFYIFNVQYDKPIGSTFDSITKKIASLQIQLNSNLAPKK